MVALSHVDYPGSVQKAFSPDLAPLYFYRKSPALSSFASAHDQHVVTSGRTENFTKHNHAFFMQQSFQYLWGFIPGCSSDPKPVVPFSAIGLVFKQNKTSIA